jgi:hypothetical protein
MSSRWPSCTFPFDRAVETRSPRERSGRVRENVPVGPSGPISARRTGSRDACAGAAPVLAAEYEPGDALDRRLQRYVDFIAAKRGLSAALHSGHPAFASLPIYFQERLRPALLGLLETAAAAGKVRAEVDPAELLLAVARLCAPNDRGGISEQSRWMVALLVDGLRYQRRVGA